MKINYLHRYYLVFLGVAETIVGSLLYSGVGSV